MHHAQGEYGRALPLYERSLKIKEKALGPEHPNVATSLNNFVSLLEQMGRRAEAKKMKARAQAIRAGHA